ncbi:hypothetical protein NPIL_595351 [Nephila pilipes]|uniref:Uncharacterized protein n=1 Tax=Nephila pilipes TaxID=299642 RepID=A0A8X6N0I3_NEPPI|nr:hypothetical protein NPIL_595351 [Nephila pilipes]
MRKHGSSTACGGVVCQSQEEADPIQEEGAMDWEDVPTSLRGGISPTILKYYFHIPWRKIAPTKISNTEKVMYDAPSKITKLGYESLAYIFAVYKQNNCLINSGRSQ